MKYSVKCFKGGIKQSIVALAKLSFPYKAIFKAFANPDGAIRLKSQIRLNRLTVCTKS